MQGPYHGLDKRRETSHGEGLGEWGEEDGFGHGGFSVCEPRDESVR